MSGAANGGRGHDGRAPHPATVVQPKVPHPAQMAQRSVRAPHPATVMQPKVPHAAQMAKQSVRAPHPATVARLPHPGKPARAESVQRMKYDKWLEHEADATGAKAAQLKSTKIKTELRKGGVTPGKLIQERPKKSEGGEDYFDEDYPGLKLIKLSGYEKYQVKETGEILYFEPGEGYYLDESRTKKADMSKYLKGERPGIHDLGGKTYCHYENSVTEGYMTIEAALDMLERFGKQSESNRQIDLGKVKSINEEIDQGRPIYPVEVRRGDSGYELVQGRHRVWASWKRGFEYIPFNVVS